MPYTYYNTDERNALQVMKVMGLPKSFRSVILDKHLSSIYREINRNRTDGVYTGNQAQYAGGDTQTSVITAYKAVKTYARAYFGEDTQGCRTGNGSIVEKIKDLCALTLYDGSGAVL